MKTLWAGLACLFLCARLCAAEAPPTETFLTSYGIRQFTNANTITRFVIKTSGVSFGSTNRTSNASGSLAWKASPGWFVYLAKDMQGWAYDGGKGLWSVSVTPLKCQITALESLKQPPPDVVLKRLPPTVKKLLPPATKPGNR